MMVEELQERLRQVNSRMQKAEDEKRAMDRENEEADAALMSAKAGTQQVRGEMEDFKKTVLSKLTALEGLHIYEVYRGWFSDLIDTGASFWMDQMTNGMDKATEAMKKQLEEAQKKEDAIKRLKREADEIRREIERAASVG